MKLPLIVFAIFFVAHVRAQKDKPSEEVADRGLAYGAKVASSHSSNSQYAASAALNSYPSYSYYYPYYQPVYQPVYQYQHTYPATYGVNSVYAGGNTGYSAGSLAVAGSGYGAGLTTNGAYTGGYGGYGGHAVHGGYAVYPYYEQPKSNYVMYDSKGAVGAAHATKYVASSSG